MKLINKKYKGFTLSELMIMLAVLTVLLAAFAPVFTVRYNNATSENVWAFVQDDEEQDAYTDQINKVMPAQLFVGLTPSSMSEVVSKAIADGASPSHTLYSKLVIRPTDQLTGSEKAQKQIQFRYGDSNTGDPVGALFAGNQNILLGGNYKDISSASNNTAYGKGALNALTTGNRNSALGYNALQSITSENDNTAIGAYAGHNINKTGNTLIGYYSSSTGDYVTAIGDNSSTTSIARGDYSTVIGSYSGTNIGKENTIIGYQAGLILGDNNTAVGNKALYAFEGAGNNNTAIGYNACAGVTGSNKTCIGYNAGANANSTPKLLQGDTERVFIGSKPIDSELGGVSVLEVHNINDTFSDVGASSVVVNGNLVVRGQYYMETRGTRFTGGQNLVGFHIIKPHEHDFQWGKVFAGYDANERNISIREKCGRRCRDHKKDDGARGCVCTSSESSPISYDWSSNTNSSGSKVKPHECMEGPHLGSYYDRTTNENVPGHKAFYNNAHTWNGTSCCPDLRSDIRLKNVSGKFTGGLNEIRNLMIYNYTYKYDEAKNPHVGVIAQDLKRVFPTAVKKDENGYYQIRWDEMLYAAINAIKTLNTKVEQLASRVAKNQVRIANLKKDNAQLEKQLDTLSAELTVLEKQHK